MTTISREVLIEAPKSEVWAVLSDFGNVYKTNPSVAESKLTSPQKTGTGVTRQCDMTMMNAKLYERVSDWQEEERLEIDIYDWDNMPGFKKMGALFTLEEVAGKTLLKATMEYSMKWGAVGKTMDSAMMRSQNIKGWEKFLAGIKHHVETGETVGKKTRLNVEPVMASAI